MNDKKKNKKKTLDTLIQYMLNAQLYSDLLPKLNYATYMSLWFRPTLYNNENALYAEVSLLN